MKITRRYTKPNTDVFSTVAGGWVKRDSRIADADGKVVFEMRGAEVPASWSQLATDIMVSKYFRKAGVPQGNAETPKRQNAETGAPDRDSEQQTPNNEPATGPERSARQVIHRLAGCWRHWGERHGYFDTAEDAQAFYDELCHMMLHQMAAPNSPQWFNTGLNWAYGINGPAQGHWVPDPKTGEVKPAPDAYTHPQPHACFIQSITDDLVNPGGIMDLWVREARLFKYGSGTGTNFSSLRAEGERLSGGGSSSGLMSWLRIGDRAAGAIKSGGTTRRAAKMVCLDADHPDIEAFVNWKVREELKVAAMVEGLKRLPKEQQELAKKLDLELNYDFNGEAYYTVSGQNSNNSVRLTDAFFDAVDADGDWTLYRRTDGRVAKTIKARELWRQISFAAWRCADPGLQYDSTINAWHTCPNSGRIDASNPCSEYMFLDDTACNLASINLLKFYSAEHRVFDIDGYEHAIRLWTMVLEISVLMAAYPSEEIARKSWMFRTLGLGYANLGAMLMQAGIPYDSDEGRAMCGVLSAILTGQCYATSGEMAGALGSFPGFAGNRDAMLRVMRNHRRAAYGVGRASDEYEDLRIRPVPLDRGLFDRGRRNIANASDLLNRAMRAWDRAVEVGVLHGYRNAQVSVIAPTGTIGLLMDCDTTGVEPDFALVKFKKLAGGGYFKIANASLRPALKSLGYDAAQIDEIVRFVMGTLSLDVPMPASRAVPGPATESAARASFREFLETQGYTSDDLLELENALPTVFELHFAFNAWSMPEHVLQARGIDVEQARRDSAFNGLRVLGLGPKEIDSLNRAICGTQTIEGAPHVKAEHLPVFDCANTCGKTGVRFIAPQGHIRMMAAAQPFISGAISKTINLPQNSTAEDIAAAYRLSWELGLKANALYRDGSKLSQPLSSKSAKDESAEDKEARAMEAHLGEASTEAAEPARATSTSSRSSAPAPGSELRERTIAHEVRTIERIVEKVVERPLRRRLPDTRRSLTHRFNVAGHEGYLTVGLYDDGRPGELFITMSKEGSTIGGLMDSLGTAISVALQYGVPVESLVNKFAHQRFEPMGMTTNRDIPFAKSLVDYIFRWMGMEFIPGYREANAPKRPGGAANHGDVRESSDCAALASPPPHLPAEIARGRGRHAQDARDAAGGNGQPVHGPGDEVGSAHVPQAQPQPKAALASLESQQFVMHASSEAIELIARSEQAIVGRSLDQSNATLMGDAPACDVCGSITVRNGTCYKCLNCGNSMGCS